MDALTVLRAQMAQNHQLIEQAIEGLTDDQLHWTGKGSTIQSIAAIYVHTVTGEDALVQGLRDQESLWSSGNLESTYSFGTNGGQLSAEWASTVKLDDVATFREYAGQVYAATDEYLASLNEADLDRVFDTGWMGETSVGNFLATIIAWHAAAHGAEMCALKGVQGETGLPF